MRQIRRNTFETNSSSTHSITMCMKSDYDKWMKGKVYLNESWGWKCTSIYRNKKFLTKEEAIDVVVNSSYNTSGKDLSTIDEEELNDILQDNEIYTYDNYWHDYLEDYKEEFTTPNGETVVSFGEYGHD